MVLGSIATSARAGDGRNHWHGSSARGGGERAGRGSNLQVFSGVCSYRVRECFSQGSPVSTGQSEVHVSRKEAQAGGRGC